MRSSISFLGIGILSVVWAQLPVAALADDRPNILWLTCEDISANLGCYGDPDAVTPHLDRFSEESVRYTNAFGVSGVCAVNRSCLITGAYSSTLGSQGMRSRTRLPAKVRCFTESLRKAGYYCTNNNKTDYNFPVPRGAWDENSKRAHYKNRPTGKPFFAVFNFQGSHESQIRVTPQQFANLTRRLTPQQRHDPAKVTVPPFHPDVPEVRRDWANYHDLITALDYWIADKLEELEQKGLAENTIVFFYSDHGAGMPGCKKWVWHSGLHVPLIVRFPEKYRRFAPGNPGSSTDRLVSFVDFAPTVLSLAGLTTPDAMQGVAFLGEDAGAARQRVYGLRDRMCERHDIVRVVRDKRYHYLRNFLPHVTWSQFVSYTEEMPTMQVWRQLAEAGQLSGPPARYFAPTKPVEELYDVEADPWQIHNLADDPQHRDVLQQMRAECREWMLRSGDLGLLPEYEMFARAKNRTPYDVAFDRQANPLPELLAAADLANAMQPENIPELVGLLRDSDDSALRWWGTVGLVALGEQSAPAVKDLRAALTDASPNVQITAAEALCNLGRHDEALPVLIASLRHPSEHIRLTAMNVLDGIGAHARPAQDAIKAAPLEVKNPVNDYVKRMSEYVPQKFEDR